MRKGGRGGKLETRAWMLSSVPARISQVHPIPDCAQSSGRFTGACAWGSLSAWDLIHHPPPPPCPLHWAAFSPDAWDWRINTWLSHSSGGTISIIGGEFCCVSQRSPVGPNPTCPQQDLLNNYPSHLLGAFSPFCSLLLSC